MYSIITNVAWKSTSGSSWDTMYSVFFWVNMLCQSTVSLGTSLLQLYISLVLPHLDYTLAIWQSGTSEHSKICVLRGHHSLHGTVATKIFWILLTSLQCQQLDTQLYSLCKIVYKLCYFYNGIFTPCTSLSHHATRNLVLNHPFARTTSYLYFFVPHTISYWNNLDPSMVCATSFHSCRNCLHVAHSTSPLYHYCS